MDIFQELVNESVIVEWYNPDWDWLWYQLLGWDEEREWIELLGERSPDGVAYVGGPLFVPLSEIASFQLRTLASSNGEHHGQIQLGPTTGE